MALQLDDRGNRIIGFLYSSELPNFISCPRNLWHTFSNILIIFGILDREEMVGVSGGDRKNNKTNMNTVGKS